MKPKSIYNSSKSLNKAISVIKSFSPQELELGPAEVARKVGISRATAHRILTTLAANSLLDQDKQTRKYTIGPVLYFLGNLYLSTRDILKAAEPIMKTLNELSRETLNLSIFNKGYITIIMKTLAKSPYRLDIHLGEMVPAHSSAMGKAFLSELTKEELDKIYPDEKLKPLTEKTVKTKTALISQLERIRKSGISYSKEEHFEGIESNASVIRDFNGRAVAAISMPVPVFKTNELILERLGTLVKMGASLISYRMGYMDNPVRDIKEICTWWEQNKPI